SDCRRVAEHEIADGEQSVRAESTIGRNEDDVRWKRADARGELVRDRLPGSPAALGRVHADHERSVCAGSRGPAALGEPVELRLEGNVLAEQRPVPGEIGEGADDPRSGR